MIIPMQTEALRAPFICYRRLSESMSSPAPPRLAACLHPHPARRLAFFFQEQVYVCCLAAETSAFPTLLKIDYMDSFVSINNSVIPARKKKKSEFPITEERRAGNLQRDARRSVVGDVSKANDGAASCCIVLLSTAAQINTRINNRN